MTTAADLTIAALRAGHDDLASVVRGLSGDQLAGPSAATEWDVSQVLSHLGSGSVIGLAGLEAALAGTPSPGADFNQSVWARWNAMSPQDRADGFLLHNAELVQRYESLDDDTRANLRIDLGFLPQPIDVATAGRFRLNEFALHSWDVRVALDPTATVRPEATPLLLGHIGFQLGWIAKPAALGGRDATLAVRLSEPEHTLGLALGDTVAVGDEPQHPDGVLTAPAEAWLRLVSGRLAPRFTPSTVSVAGPIDLDLLRAVFPGY